MTPVVPGTDSGTIAAMLAGRIKLFCEGLRRMVMVTGCNNESGQCIFLNSMYN